VRANAALKPSALCCIAAYSQLRCGMHATVLVRWYRWRPHITGGSCWSKGLHEAAAAACRLTRVI
jgi:hypothetical protein